MIMSLEEYAASLEARGLTGPDKHDISLVRLGQDVRLFEIWRRADGLVEVKAGETTVARVEDMFRTLPVDHNLGLVTLITGTDPESSDFLVFLKKQAQRRNFTVTMLARAPTGLSSTISSRC